MKNNKSNEKFEGSLKLLVKTSIIVFIGIFLSKVLSYVYRIIVARYYGPEVYGLFSLAIMVFGWAVAFSSLGFIEGLLRFIPQYNGKKESEEISYIFRFATKVLFITSIVSAILLFMLSNFIAINIFHNAELELLLKILSIFVPIAVLSNVFLAPVRSYEFIGMNSFIYNILQNIVKVLSLGIFILISFNASSTVISYGLGFLTVLMASFIFCKYKISNLFLKSKLASKNKKKIRKSFISYSFPLLFFGMISILFYWIDSFFLGYFKTAEIVGFYNAAVPIALLLLITPDLFMQLFFPMINRYYTNKDYELIKQLSKQIGKWVFMANLPIFILIFIFPGAALNILFGSQYLLAENSLKILIFGSFIMAISIISNNLLSMAGKSKLVLIDIVIASIVNIILNIILVPMSIILGIDNSVGMIGASLATAISMILLSILFFFQARKNLGILPIRNKMINILLIGIISTIGLLYLKNQVPFSIIRMVILFLLAYILLLIISKSLDQNDWKIVGAIFRKLKRN